MARLSSPDTLSLALSEAPCPDPGSPEHLVSRRQVLDRVTSHPGPARYRSSRHVSKLLVWHDNALCSPGLV